MKSNITFSETNADKWDATVAEWERKDRYIVDYVLPQAFNENTHNISFTPMPQNCRVDAEATCTYNGKKYTYKIEVKNYTRTSDNCFVIKQDKVEGMQKECKAEDKLIFVAIYNGNTYWFNCDQIDWKQVKAEWKWQKCRQVDPNSNWAYYYTYYLPLSMAKKVIPCEKAEQMYNKEKTEWERISKLYFNK